MEEKSLVAIGQTVIGDSEVNSVNARDLHELLGSKQQFADWIKSKVVDNAFFKKEFDWIESDSAVSHSMKQKVGRNKKDYTLTIDTAKKIAMSEQTAKGEEVRTYFIRYEKEFIKTSNKLKEKAVSFNVLSIETKAAIALANLYGISGNQALLSANKAVNTMYGINCLALLEIQGLENKSKSQYFTLSVAGKNIAK